MVLRPFPGAALVLCWTLAVPAVCAGFRPEPGEQVFLDLMDRDHHPIEAREAAKAYLAQHPKSFLACEVIGMVYLNSEGDLPKALYYLDRSRSLMEARYGGRWGDGTPTGNYHAVLSFLYTTQYSMERYEDALATLRTRDEMFVRKWPAGHAWPLMKLGRFQEARAKIAEAVEGGDPYEVSNALNTLAALEAESDRPEASFETEMRIYRMDLPAGRNRDCTFIRNTGDGARLLGMMARAEKFFLEATEHFDSGTVSNPWSDLACLYLAEQRLPEALDAVKQMHLWAFHSNPREAQTHWNVRQTYTGGVLLACGCTDEALVIARRLVERPDRHATGSARDGQREAGTQLFHYQVLQDALARDDEAFSYAPWKSRPGILLRKARHTLEAALALRRTGSLLMENRERLGHTLRVLAPQSIVDVPGGELYLARIVGPGVAEGEIRSLLARKGPAAVRERGFLMFALGAARMERGDARGALEALAAADPLLPAEYAVFRTQLLALKARAQTARGDYAGALESLVGVMERDGGEIRRMGLRLPCRIEASPGALADQAARLLGSSPRLAPGTGGFRVVVEQAATGGLVGGLDGPRGAVLSRFHVPPGKDADATVREFCRQFHRRAFGPKIDLSQQQIRSLEGSTLSSQGAEEHLKGIMGP